MACRRTFTRCGHHGCVPNNWQSTMCDSIVTGCQLRATSLCHTHLKPLTVRPAFTTGFAVMKSGSS